MEKKRSEHLLFFQRDQGSKAAWQGRRYFTENRPFLEILSKKVYRCRSEDYNSVTKSRKDIKIKAIFCQRLVSACVTFPPFRPLHLVTKPWSHVKTHLSGHKRRTGERQVESAVRIFFSPKAVAEKATCLKAERSISTRDHDPQPLHHQPLRVSDRNWLEAPSIC